MPPPPSPPSDCVHPHRPISSILARESRLAPDPLPTPPPSLPCAQPPPSPPCAQPPRLHTNNARSRLHPRHARSRLHPNNHTRSSLAPSARRPTGIRPRMPRCRPRTSSVGSTVGKQPCPRPLPESHATVLIQEPPQRPTLPSSSPRRRRLPQAHPCACARTDTSPSDDACPLCGEIVGPPRASPSAGGPCPPMPSRMWCPLPTRRSRCARCSCDTVTVSRTCRQLLFIGPYSSHPSSDQRVPPFASAIHAPPDSWPHRGAPFLPLP
jgi:hypothetical protein